MLYIALAGTYNTIFKKTYDSLFGDDIKERDPELREKLKELREELGEAAKEAGETFDNFYDDFIEWIRAFDPV